MSGSQGTAGMYRMEMENGRGTRGLFRTEPRSMWKINLHSASFLGTARRERGRGVPPTQVINKRINSFLRTISPLAAIPAHTNCLLSGRSNWSRRRDFVGMLEKGTLHFLPELIERRH